MRRWPIRIRLTAAFTLAMALVLVAVAVVTVLNTGASLDESIDAGLQYRLESVQSAAAQQTPELAQDGRNAASQILDAQGRILAGTPGTEGRLLLDPVQARAAAQGRVVVERPGIGSLPGPVRVAAAAAADGRIAVAAVSLADRDATVGDLSGELAVSFPLVLAAAAAGAYLLAAGLLRPVERMRARAAAMTDDEPGELLPVPPADDEISRLGRTFNGLLARLRDSLQRERRFVADASHDLRTPLSLLTTELELALRRPRSADELAQALRSALEETGRLSRLAEDLLTLSKAGQPPETAWERTDLKPVLEAVAARYRALAGGRNVSVDCPQGLAVRASRDDLERAVGNLLDNALEHGRGPVTLRGSPVRTEEGGQGVAVEVRDHGPGIDPGFLPHAFGRFTRADAARSSGGAGLGLAIAAALAHRNGGRATADNHPDGGAVLILTLPGSGPFES